MVPRVDPDREPGRAVKPPGKGRGKAMAATMETDVLETRDALEGRELTAWLESAEGEAWSKASHVDASRHSLGVFADVKDDHPATCPGDGSDIELANRWGLEILSEVAWYGMSGLPAGR
jgi:hypothetical protein